jgi:hypothetical protein
MSSTTSWRLSGPAQAVVAVHASAKAISNCAADFFMVLPPLWREIGWFLRQVATLPGRQHPMGKT